jgi:tRNA threonylcarbamoyladenosine biosynthesis protein TsaB
VTVTRVLALDTTGEVGSLALVEDGRVVEEIEMESADGFAHVLFGEIEALLARRGLGIGEIDLFAAGSGPGSFTGVRVGLTAVKGLAEATGRRAAAVSNLRAVASFGCGAVRAAFIDARRGEIYGGIYNDALELIGEEVVIAFDRWRSMIPEGPEIIERGTRPLAGAIGQIAASRPELARDPAEIDANYVRRSDAELLWKEA